MQQGDDGANREESIGTMWGVAKASGLWVHGRYILNLWRMARSEVTREYGCRSSLRTLCIRITLTFAGETIALRLRRCSSSCAETRNPYILNRRSRVVVRRRGRNAVESPSVLSATSVAEPSNTFEAAADHQDEVRGSS